MANKIIIGLILGISLSLSLINAQVNSRDKISWETLFTNEEGQQQTEFLMNKGAFTKIFVEFKRIDDTTAKRIQGKLAIGENEKAKGLIFSTDIYIDTTDKLQYVIYIGLSCSSTLEAAKIPLTFMLQDEKESVKIKWQNLNIDLVMTPTKFKILSTLNPIHSGSFSQYIITNEQEKTSILNVDSFIIEFDKVQGGSKNSGVINSYTMEPFNPNARDYMYMTGYFSGGLFEADDVEFSAKILSKNLCYEAIEPVFKWKVENKTISLIKNYNKKTIKAEVNTPSTNELRFHLEISLSPLLVSCGASSKAHVNYLEEEYVTHPNEQVAKVQPNLLYFQTYTTKEEGRIDVRMKGANRFLTDYTVICYLQTLRNIDGKLDVTDVLKLKMTGKKSDFALKIKAETPIPSQCVVWRFSEDSSNKIEDFGKNAVNYCNEQFGEKELSLYNNGCLICEERVRDFFENTQKSICLRTSINCPLNYPQGKTIKTDFAKFVSTIDTKEKIMDIMKIEVSDVKGIQQLSDDDTIDFNAIKPDTTSFSVVSALFSYKSSFKQELACKFKRIKDEPVEKITEEDFLEIKSEEIFLPEKQQAFEVEFDSAVGLDNKIYFAVGMCYNLAKYDYHYYHTEPFVFKEIFRNDGEKPAPDEKKEKKDCTKDPLNAECILFKAKDIPVDLKTYDLDFSKKFNVFLSMEYEVQNLVIQGEINVLIDQLITKQHINANGLTESQIQLKPIQDIVYISELMNLRNCLDQNDYDKCRKTKSSNLSNLIKALNLLFPSAQNIVDVLKTIDEPFQTTFITLTAAFYEMSNNADGYSEDILIAKQLFDFTHIIADKFNEIVLLIEEKKAKQNFYEIILAHHINLIEIEKYLEYDSLIQKGSKADILENKSDGLNIEQLRSDIETLLAKSFEFNRDHIKYDTIFEMYLKIKSDVVPSFTTGLEILYFGDKITVTINSDALFKANSDLKFIQIYSFDKHPSMMFNAINYYKHPVSFKFYGLKDNKMTPITLTKLDPSPSIKIEMTNVNEKFTEVFVYNAEKNDFITEKAKLDTETPNKIKYSIVTISTSGDYTIGLAKSTSWLWLIILGGVLVVGLVGGLIYLIIAVLRNRRKHPNIESIDPLLNNA